MREQKLVVLGVESSGIIKLTPHNEEDWKSVEQIFEAGWSIDQMVSTERGTVLLLLGREKPGRSGSGSLPY